MTLPSLAFDAAVLAVLPYPRIDPVAFSLGPFVLRWYALSYLSLINIRRWRRAIQCKSSWFA
ncbi:MAG: hypothetical protein MPJ79_03095, partial [Alphaproteobacteria bacterium]|nr:hypothetical protein [Alphaproteobacteria bacterium]